MCTPWLSISWRYRPICQSTCQLSIGRLLITILVDCWLTCRQICWSTLDHYVGRCIGQHTECRPTYRSVYQSTPGRYKGCQLWWNISRLLVAHQLTVVCHKFSINPPGGLFISSPFEGGLNRDGGLIIISCTLHFFPSNLTQIGIQLSAIHTLQVKIKFRLKIFNLG